MAVRDSLQASRTTTKVEFRVDDAAFSQAGRLTMAIKRRPKGAAAAASDVAVPTFSFAPNDSLAQLIVDAWVDDNLREKLLKRDKGHVTAENVEFAKLALAARGLYLTRAVVISEAEHDRDYIIEPGHEDDEVVLVLPNLDRVTPRPGQSLLDTARFLMSCTPNGI